MSSRRCSPVPKLGFQDSCPGAGARWRRACAALLSRTARSRLRRIVACPDLRPARSRNYTRSKGLDPFGAASGPSRTALLKDSRARVARKRESDWDGDLHLHLDRHWIDRFSRADSACAIMAGAKGDPLKRIRVLLAN